MSDLDRPFARTQDAARQVRTAMSGYGAARSEDLSLSPALTAEAPADVVDVEEVVSAERVQLGQLAFHAEDRPYRGQVRRSRWPWLLTVIVVAASVQLMRLAYEEATRLQPTIPAAQQELSVINPPPESLPKPAAEANQPPKPRFKPD